MELGPTKNGDYVAPFTARYYQTLPTVTTGQANGMATLTLSSGAPPLNGRGCWRRSPRC